ncbi:MAG TPA: hypothetical protein VKB18_07225 [Gemmatimonadota bacterium]|nr:hypothetical protein [Gemmatimonadota bacterium]
MKDARTRPALALAGAIGSLALVGFAGLPAAAGAGAHAGADAPAPDTVVRDTVRKDSARGDTTRATIINDTDFTLRIYVVPSGATYRYLGTVMGLDSATWRLHEGDVGPSRVIRFVGRPVAGPRDVGSNDFYIGRGETVTWRIEPPLPFGGMP